MAGLVNFGKRLVPAACRPFLRNIYLNSLDRWDRWRGRGNPLVPPRTLLHNSMVGRDDFLGIGHRYLKFFQDLGGLKPNDRVLDVGSGLGRMAVGMIDYLKPPGSYDGIEIMPDCVAWCKSSITPKYPHFQFHHIDAYNLLYHPQSTVQAKDFEFPFPNHRFDFVILSSVFTHMLPEDVRGYLKQARRVLRKGGKVFSTFFLLNEESRRLSEANRGRTYNFDHCFGQYSAVDAKVPELAIAYDERHALDIFEQARLKVSGPLHYGSWCGRAKGLSYQDIVILEKPCEPD